MSESIFPLWRVPKKSPPPRISRSFSAMAKPSALCLMADSRSRDSGVSMPGSRKQ